MKNVDSEDLEAARRLFLQLAEALLAADLRCAGWRASAIAEAVDCKRKGSALVLEISSDATGAVQVALVAAGVGISAPRRVLDTVRDRAAPRAH